MRSRAATPRARRRRMIRGDQRARRRAAGGASKSASASASLRQRVHVTISCHGMATEGGDEGGKSRSSAASRMALTLYTQVPRNHTQCRCFVRCPHAAAQLRWGATVRCAARHRRALSANTRRPAGRMHLASRCCVSSWRCGNERTASGASWCELFRFSRANSFAAMDTDWSWSRFPMTCPSRRGSS